MIVEMGKKTLKRLGYSVTTRTSSIKALELFRMKPMEFNLVITDQTMPQMTGTDLAREILRIRPNIPIILCTGFSHTVNSENMGIQGIREFVIKPIFPLSSPRFSACCAKVSAFNQKLTLSSSKCNNTQVPSILVCDKTLSSDARALKDNNLKEILFVIFALLFVVGLIVFRLKFIKDRNPNVELLIELLRWMSANEVELDKGKIFKMEGMEG